MQHPCLFCQMVRGEAPCHRIWEDEHYLAFLSIYPNTDGFSVVIPKEHYPSYAFDLPDEILQDFILAVGAHLLFACFVASRDTRNQCAKRGVRNACRNEEKTWLW